MATNIFSPEDIVIKRVRLYAERFPSNYQYLNLAGFENDNANGAGGAPIVTELSIYENLFKPYLTATMTIQDDQDLYRLADISGVERVEIEFEAPGGDQSVPITKTFIITAIEDIIKTNDYNTILNISLIEDVAFYNSQLNLSKAYTGTCEEIIFKIIEDNFSFKGLKFDSNNISFQKAFRYIAPNVDPFTAIDHILAKMTTELGMPFFLYSSLYEDNFVITDLNTILTKDALNKDKPFVYSQASASIVSSQDINTKALSVYSYDPGQLENTFALTQQGAIGFKFNAMNATNGNLLQTKNVSIKEYLKAVADASNLPEGQTLIQIDEDFIADPSGQDNRRLTEFTPVIFNTLVGETYRDGLLSYDGDQYEMFLRLVKEHVMTNMLKNMYSIHVPGLIFSFNNPSAAVGNQIELDVFKNNPEDERSDMIDHKKSGSFVILNRRHIIDFQNKGRHTVVLNIARLFNKVQLSWAMHFMEII